MNDTTLSPSDVIDTLNGLIELSRDGQHGYEEAAQKIDSPDTKTFCLEQSRQRAHFVGELQTLVHVLGDEPDNTGTLTGALRRGWMDLKSALGGGDHAILVVVESSEDQAVREYQKALTKTLPADVREIVQRQSYSVKQAHDTIHVMRDRLAI
ncbi:PA2169 family four-helix-bundle protein [Rhodoferax sp. AJA081-3]|uniref:ferritin-like domain-containing protein n=1 Tax=Rhodoferax sp. AJA081-3 TaxID=2752316 RepID=UPI001ADF26D9|nr:PA2169 family four-helix-bundle protein [Rhodoferax sp. AJA081-3]QTN28141.1 PA2169 family four-helix-bundle protein [Rhodoferax sp. AJA081-3]